MESVQHRASAVNAHRFDETITIVRCVLINLLVRKFLFSYEFDTSMLLFVATTTLYYVWMRHFVCHSNFTGPKLNDGEMCVFFLHQGFSVSYSIEILFGFLLCIEFWPSSINENIIQAKMTDNIEWIDLQPIFYFNDFLGAKFVAWIENPQRIPF